MMAGGEFYARKTPITPAAQLIPPTCWAQGPTKLPKLPKICATRLEAFNILDQRYVSEIWVFELI